MSDQPPIVTRADAAREILARREARRSLLAFTQYTHPKWQTEEHHPKVCHRLEQLERREECPRCHGRIEKLGVFAPPRSAKTELSLRRFSAWAMGRNPGWHVISAMANSNLAVDTGGEVRDIVASEDYARVFPDSRLQQDAKSSQRWVLINGVMRGVYYCGGIDSSFPGRGANVLNIDDPHKSAQEADSQRMRDLAAKAYFGDLVQRLESPSIQLLTNTRRHSDDLAGRVIAPSTDWLPTDDEQFFCDGQGWHVLRLRAIEHEGTPYEVALRSRGCPATASPLDHMSEMREMYISKGRARYWNSEFQQSPVLEEGKYIKAAWFTEHYDPDHARGPDHPDGRPEGLRLYMASDFAVTDKADAPDPDWTEHGVFALAPDDRLYVMDWWGGQTTADVWIDSLLDLVAKWKPMAWFGTKGQIRRSIEPLLTRRMRERRTYVRVEWLPDDKDKAIKGRPFQAWASSGRVIFPYGRAWAERVKSQCVGFLAGATHDDAFDTMANMCRAIDQTHPAIVQPVADCKKPRDVWDHHGSSAGQSEDWKSV